MLMVYTQKVCTHWNAVELGYPDRTYDLLTIIRTNVVIYQSIIIRACQLSYSIKHAIYTVAMFAFRDPLRHEIKTYTDVSMSDEQGLS
jgi:hypothetical protein